MNVNGYGIKPVADFRGAYLRWSNLYLRCSDLEYADLQDAYLERAYLRWSNLGGAELAYAGLFDELN